ncbi:MAG: chromosomal replication initiator protein DnaA [Magnetococcales bacterium]|nr:chromosomal replication initiator protein DnaA [Magnetococcales bacterium]NGZ28681.1 chromosomal replication initiator protein DnaA [Magnetococcales bacterium]
MDTYWNNTLARLRDQLPSQIFEAWIKPLRPDGTPNNGLLTVFVANDFTVEWVQSRYGSLLEDILTGEMGQPVRIDFRVGTPDSPLADADDDRDEDTTTVEEPIVARAIGVELTELERRYTFENFVVGSSNQFVCAAAERVADFPAKAYNPLFIYGGTGLGKTHILHAIGNQVRQQRPDMRVLYTTSEKFMTQLINSIRFKRVFDFKENFRSVDMLMVDDIQFIAGKERTQEEFFHTFNALFESSKQIIITSDQYPNDIKDLEDRLRSRFAWGLVADIQPPELETRIAILEKKAALEGLPLPRDVAFFLANSIQNNIRELEGALIRISAYASLTGKPVSMGLARECLRDLFKGQDKQISVETIQKTVAAYFKIRLTDLKSEKRNRIFSHPRQVAMYLCKRLTDQSYPEIGHQFGGRDHTTVLHAVRKIEETKNQDNGLGEDLETLASMLRR